MGIDKMVFDKNGNMEPIVMTKDGPGVLLLAPRRED
jgi:hypothetical protein